ncbi:MAG: hypothetical protein JO356_18910 [Acidobacteria bacterium]|nr:hypothetical protein [Acidobacteriota bacterium]
MNSAGAEISLSLCWLWKRTKTCHHFDPVPIVRFLAGLVDDGYVYSMNWNTTGA